jgi:valine--pyruvate aminotransferase
MIIKTLGNLAGVTSLAPGNTGPVLAEPIVRNRQILAISQELIRPFYQQKATYLLTRLKAAIPDHRFRIHRPEGAIFLWLWFDDLPITTQQLYQRLKEKGLVVVAGQHFFPGLTDNWKHKQECLRLSYAQPEESLDKAVAILAEEVNSLYGAANA